MPDFDISNLWWLRTDNPRVGAEALQGLQLGAQIAQNRIKMQQDQEQLKVQTTIRLMDLMMERDRNNLALRTFQSKQDADMLRARGMTELGEFLGNATSSNKLTDPETQAQFWRLTSKYAPYMDHNTVNSIWDNTFKAAIDRDQRSKGISEKGFEFEARRKMLKEADTEIESARAEYQSAMQSGDEEAIRSASKKLFDAERNAFYTFHVTGVPDPERATELNIQRKQMPDGTVHDVLILPDGKQRVLKSIDPKKMSDKDRIGYNAERRAAAESYSKLDPLYLKPDGKGGFIYDAQYAAEKYASELDRINRAYGGEDAKPPGTGAGTNQPSATQPRIQQLQRIPLRLDPGGNLIDPSTGKQFVFPKP